MYQDRLPWFGVQQAHLRCLVRTDSGVGVQTPMVCGTCDDLMQALILPMKTQGKRTQDACQGSVPDMAPCSGSGAFAHLGE